MGGRGAKNNTGSSIQPTSTVAKVPQAPPQAAPQKPKSAAEAKDISELRQYAKDTLGIKLASTLDQADYGLVQQAVSDYEFLKSEFPKWGAMTGIRMEPLKKGTNAQTNGEIITLAEYRYTNPTGFAAKVAQGEAVHYYPKGTTNLTTAVHEMGHTFEYAMCKKYNPGNDTLATWNRLDAWNHSKYSKQIISEACKAAKKTPDGKGKLNSELTRQVSLYATTKPAEALAECVRDYYINRNNAQPLSREVWKILKKEFG